MRRLPLHLGNLENQLRGFRKDLRSTKSPSDEGRNAIYAL
jgi:hypothetical protein